MAKTVEQLLSEARRRIRNATPDEVADTVLSGELLVLDVREPEEFEQGHLPGALNIPRGWLELRADPTWRAHDERLAPDKPVLVYCTVGPRSILAGAALRGLGYTSVTNLDEGLVAWKNAGYPVTQPEGAPAG
jgi:rhodanese-related sulfurtransferase